MIETTEHLRDIYQQQAELCRVLDHPVRLAILDLLRDGEQCVCHIEANLGLRQAYISQHLMALREAGLVEDRRDGRSVFYRVVRREVYKVTDAMAVLTGQPKRQVDQMRAAAPCPCPKCNASEHA